MKKTAMLRSLAVVGVATAIVVSAVHNAAASVEIARATVERAEAQRRIRIMITPQVANNDINITQKSKAIDVAVIQEGTWDFADIDGQTVEFAGAIPSRTATKSQDVDNDGMADRIYTFTTGQLKIAETDTLKCLTFETIQKQKMQGCDRIKVITKSP